MNTRGGALRLAAQYAALPAMGVGEPVIVIGILPAPEGPKYLAVTKEGKTIVDYVTFFTIVDEELHQMFWEGHGS